MTEAAVDRRDCGTLGHTHPRAVYPVPEQLRELFGAATGRDVRIAVVDSGWDRTVRCTQVAEGVGVVAPDNPFQVGVSDDRDRIGHGTAAVDIILRIAPEAEIVPIRVFGDRLETSVAVLAAGLEVAERANADLVNLSVGTMLPHAEGPLEDRCAQLAASAAFVVAAGHNEGLDSFPAVSNSVIGVRRARFASAFGVMHDASSRIEFLARAQHSDVLWLNGGRVDLDASSFAAPVLTGISALLVERFHPRSVEELRRLLAGLGSGSG